MPAGTLGGTAVSSDACMKTYLEKDKPMSYIFFRKELTMLKFFVRNALRVRVKTRLQLLNQNLLQKAAIADSKAYNAVQ